MELTVEMRMQRLNTNMAKKGSEFWAWVGTESMGRGADGEKSLRVDFPQGASWERAHHRPELRLGFRQQDLRCLAACTGLLPCPPHLG